LNIGQMRNAYLVSVIGVGLMAVMTAYNVIRALMTRPMFQASTGAAQFAGRRQFGMNPFGLSNGLTIIALIVAIVGLVWLGLAFRKSHQNSTGK
jgi:TctA family transporter